MPLLRPNPSALVRSIKQTQKTTTSTTSTATTSIGKRSLSSTPARSAGHAPHYDQPGGWLWGVPPGTKPKKESWENMMIYGYCGAILVTGIAYVYKPDTSIQTWALEEARRRLEAEGILEDPNPEGKEE